jgi:poly-D-alanine transfer protein DltD
MLTILNSKCRMSLEWRVHKMVMAHTFLLPFFDDCDEANAGLAGEFTASTDYVSMANMMENLSVSTMNLIEDELVNRVVTNDRNNIDEINIMRSRYQVIKHKLVALGCAGYLEQIQKFIKPVEEQISYEKVKAIANTLKVDTFNGFFKRLLQ